MKPIFFWFLALFYSVHAQKISHCEYWFNNNLLSKQHISIPPTSEIQFTGAFSTSSLTDGLNIIHIRFGDDSGRYSVPISQYFYRRTPSSPAAARITAYQYWIDNQHGSSVLQTVSPGASLNFNAAIDFTTLQAGLHLFHIRFRDNTNMWSSPATHYIYKPPTHVASGLNGIVSLQYWMDADVQHAVTKSLTTEVVLNLTESLPLQNYAGGIHLFNYRMKDALGQWSSITSQFIYINPSYGNAMVNGICKMQYWFNENIAAAKDIQFAVAPVIMANEDINTSGLSDGLHRLNIRFRDTSGHWSTTVSSFIYKFDNSAITNNVITGYRYWFNNFGEGEMVEHTLLNQQALTLNTVIDMGCLASGANRIHVQFQDKKGLWSTGITDTLTVHMPPSNIYRFTGSGNWSNAANWQNNNVPAPDIPGCKEVIIDHAPGGSCYLDVQATILKSSRITVMPGKILVLPQHLRIKN
jgi:hypothetical protein